MSSRHFDVGSRDEVAPDLAPELRPSASLSCLPGSPTTLPPSQEKSVALIAGPPLGAVGKTKGKKLDLHLVVWGALTDIFKKCLKSEKLIVYIVKCRAVVP